MTEDYFNFFTSQSKVEMGAEVYAALLDKHCQSMLISLEAIISDTEHYDKYYEVYAHHVTFRKIKYARIPAVE